MQLFSHVQIDPVCGMRVDPHHTALTACQEGHRYYFCKESCLRAFEANPQKYWAKGGRKNWWRRYLERLRRVTGGKSMSCH